MIIAKRIPNGFAHRARVENTRCPPKPSDNSAMLKLRSGSSFQRRLHAADRFELWATEAERFGIDQRLIRKLRIGRQLDASSCEQVVSRLAGVPRQLTEHESIFEKQHLYAAVGAALVGTRTQRKPRRFTPASRSTGHVSSASTS